MLVQVRRQATRTPGALPPGERIPAGDGCATRSLPGQDTASQRKANPLPGHGAADTGRISALSAGSRPETAMVYIRMAASTASAMARTAATAHRLLLLRFGTPAHPLFLCWPLPASPPSYWRHAAIADFFAVLPRFWSAIRIALTSLEEDTLTPCP